MGETATPSGRALMVGEGDRILGRYRVIRRLGEGGQGAVFEAEDEATGARVAVKYALLAGAGGALTRRQFEREGALLRALDHPGLPKVFDVAAGDAFCAIVMEYVAGEDLARARARRGAPFEPRDVVLWADQLLDILCYLHAQSPPVLHRDVKPANIKVLPGGRVVLLDFGLARVSRAGRGATANSIVGYTETFAPFEQTQGEAVGPDGDLFSLGATIYWLLAPRPAPTAAARVFAMALGRPDPIAPLSAVSDGVPGFVSAAVHRALSVHPDERFHSARAMRDALAGLEVEDGVEDEEEAVTRVRKRRVTVPLPVATTAAAQPALREKSGAEAPRRRGRWWAAAVAALALGGGAIGAVSLLGERPGLVAESPVPPAAETPAPGPPQPVPAPSAFSVEMEGEVGGRDGLRMRLERRGPAVTGSFVWAGPTGVGDFAETRVEGTVEPDGRVVLTEYGSGRGDSARPTGAFTGSMLADPVTGELSFSGTWSTPSGDSQGPFSLRERDLGLPAGSQVVAKRHELRGTRPVYRVDAVYPAIEGGSAPNAWKFNAAVEEVVSEWVDDWVKDVGDDGREQESRLTMRYEVTHGAAGLVSVRLFVASYLGRDEGLFWDRGPSQEFSYDALTFDLQAGRRVELEEVFRPEAPYRERLARAALGELQRRGVEVWPEDLEDEEFRAWNLVPGGLLLSFAPDRIAPNEAGDVSVLIEHEALEGLYREGGPASRARPQRSTVPGETTNNTNRHE